MYSTNEAAQQLGVSKNTLLRWLDEGLIDDVQRDWRGWRVWTQQDIDRAKSFQKNYHNKPHKRVRRSAMVKAEFAKAAAQSMEGFSKAYCRRPEIGQ